MSLLFQIDLCGTYNRRSVVRVHADGGSSGAGDPGDGVERLTDVDVEVGRFATLVHSAVCEEIEDV